MLTNKQIDKIDELATREKYWNTARYKHMPLTPDIVLSLTTELKRQRRLIAAVRQAWLDEGDYPLQHREASEWVRANWPNLAAALERLAQNSAW